MFSNPPEWVQTAQELLTKFGLKTVAAILIFVIGRWVAKLLKNLLQKMMERAKVDAAIVGFTVSLVHAAMMIFVVLAALGQVGVETTSFIAVLGAAGLAVGLALQGSLSNFASGVLILIFRPFKAGDYIEGADTAGVVKTIHIFTTTLTTLDNKRVIVPNSKLMSDNIINYSAEGKRRLDLVACISYGDSIDTAKAAMMDELTKDERVLKDPAPFVGVLAMNDSSIDLAVRPWVTVADYWDVFFTLNERIKKRLEEEGCTIPFPQRDVHIYKED
ncbi:mechanosensitive ion channel [Tichowtungia aerotolerans]|uniref:Mechanosensitive ion channel n=2 Tax=Tichowtungia aerotolerans TaxID=2697043 RepID=A0A6P1M8C8_9BACT|nr:mechanosensitive ion channel [Tichowtungia aerotolerans]